jgi:hypothetical protein
MDPRFGSRTDSQAAHAGSGFQIAGLIQKSEVESSILAAQRAINTPATQYIIIKAALSLTIPR